VRAPALNAPAGQDRAGVVGARRDRLDSTTETDDLHRGRTVDTRAVAQLSRGVVTPALDAAVGQEGAGVTLACRDRLGSPSHARDGRRRVAFCRRSIAKLAGK